MTACLVAQNVYSGGRAWAVRYRHLLTTDAGKDDTRTAALVSRGVSSLTV